jgi:drug/metabolite transporter (DMT)-like permease
MLAAGLALSASFVWGVVDFVGGTLARRHPVATVALLGHATGLLALAVAVAFVGVDERALLFGVAAGAFGSVAVFTFYKAMSLGKMSIASPLLACGSILAFAAAVAAGERPSILAVAGALIALLGAVLASLEEHASGGDRRAALVFSFASMVALGGYLFLLGRGSDGGGTFSAVLGARATSSSLLLVLVFSLGASLRIGWRAYGVLSLIGLGAAGAFLLYGFAADVGLISIASVLSSLYPVVTVVLAHVFLGERLGRVQLAGVPLVLVGIVLVTAA